MLGRRWVWLFMNGVDFLSGVTIILFQVKDQVLR